MAELGWLTRDLDDVPSHDRWLSEPERAVLSRLRTPKRRADWRLGRWAGKAAVAAWRGVAPEAVVIMAGENGAPEALIDGQRGASLSLSHRAGRALAMVADPPMVVGCDLEPIEPRSGAFLREWLRPVERELVSAQTGEARQLTANLIWTAKEAASKAMQEGLRLNIRQATVEVDGPAQPAGSWSPLRVSWENGSAELGWWRRDAGWVMTAISDPASEAAPSELSQRCE
ncbi:MAG TPA: 4'-phosphopantetheinyl transferase superfamily protein [Solirubrobacterales bacterium]|nr:4'-phosphopantetheinyl transferase superfamily protein [Solirubrobacterales bacterium]